MSAAGKNEDTDNIQVSELLITDPIQVRILVQHIILTAILAITSLFIRKDGKPSETGLDLEFVYDTSYHDPTLSKNANENDYVV